MDEWLQQFDAKDPGLKDGTPQWISALQAGNEWKPMELPAYWETRGLNFDGTVWFQKKWKYLLTGTVRKLPSIWR